MKFTELLEENLPDHLIQKQKDNDSAKSKILDLVKEIETLHKIVVKETKGGYPKDDYKLKNAIKEIGRKSNNIEIVSRNISKITGLK